MNKKGFELIWQNVVYIVLALIILVVLLVFWNSRTGVFSDLLDNFIGKTNVDDVGVSCNMLVTKNSEYEYCCVNKTVKFYEDEKLVRMEMSCKEIRERWGDVDSLSCSIVC